MPAAQVSGQCPVFRAVWAMVARQRQGARLNLCETEARRRRDDERSRSKSSRVVSKALSRNQCTASLGADTRRTPERAVGHAATSLFVDTHDPPRLGTTLALHQHRSLRAEAGTA